ncbi:hypothetical protein AGLY_002571 [Aphis glycines]|uniref:Histone-lysine N-methyltransferase n=1 Tax=Aphis glycines TaxID=307491 RepID=A0A6G0U1K1_APHGL|nr:hypothetical protein AGLY_002571 [Aphis glycines]
MSDDLSRNSNVDYPSTSGVNARYSNLPETTSSIILQDFKNNKIQKTTSSNLETDSNLSENKATSSFKEKLDAFDAAILSADNFLKSFNKYPNNAKAMSEVVDNVDSNKNEKSRAENNSSSRSSSGSNSSSRCSIETDEDISRDNFDQNSNDFTSKTNFMASTSKMKTLSKSLLHSNSDRGHKRSHQSDSESECEDTAIIIVPSVEEIVDPSYSTRFYLVKWKNWSKGFNTWERYGSLYKSQKLLLKYIENKNKPVDGYLNPIDGTLLMMSRKMITTLFETFKTESGISLPTLLPEDISGLYNSLDVGTMNSQKYKNRSLQYFLPTIVLGYLRQRQLFNLKQWEIEINVVTQDNEIKVENNMDLEGPPDSFVYISEYVPQADIIISDDPPIGCNCKKNCKIPESCCYEMTGCLKAYDKNKNIIVIPGHPVYECNKKCKCSSACTNRVVQLGSKVNVCIYKTRRTGWGVKSTQNIQKGQFVARYIGEIITVEESEDRLRDGLSNIDYTWNLDFNDPQNYKYIIDGTHFANFTRFINHSCSSNLNVYAVWINCLDRNLPQLALFANRDIVAGEQLTTNYFSRIDKSTLKKSGIRCRCDMKNLYYLICLYFFFVSIHFITNKNFDSQLPGWFLEVITKDQKLHNLLEKFESVHQIYPEEIDSKECNDTTLISTYLSPMLTIIPPISEESTFNSNLIVSPFFENACNVFLTVVTIHGRSPRCAAMIILKLFNILKKLDDGGERASFFAANCKVLAFNARLLIGLSTNSIRTLSDFSADFKGRSNLKLPKAKCQLSNNIKLLSKSYSLVFNGWDRLFTVTKKIWIKK